MTMETKPKPTHYKIVSISLYTEDQERLAALVQQAKARGWTKANGSEVIRKALEAIEDGETFEKIYPIRR